ncbi:MAG: NAD(P)H-hydrate dehydratase [Nonlabens sp.]|uniref:NAD(P)H-hydrate dehydratase n=1 Tax=Nonlabens sp. TaxID=1888209 RepID=UPI003EF4B8BA
MKILSAQQLAEADLSTINKNQITSNDLMERIAQLIFERIHQRLQGSPVPIKIFCGIGKNGGDGLALARHMIQHGYHVKVYVTNFSKKRAPEFLFHYDKIKEVTKDWPVLLSSKEDFPEINQQDIIVDAIFGTGINRPIEGWMIDLVHYINKSPAFKLAIDVPSGLYANTPQVIDAPIIQAQHTFSFETPKLSFYLPQTGKYAGTFEVIKIGLDPEYLMKATPLAQIITPDAARSMYKPREKFSHKGDYGHVLTMAGSKGKVGAAILAAGAAMNMGAGKVTAYLPEEASDLLQSSLPEVMTITGKGEHFITDFEHDLKDITLCVGPGLSTGDDVKHALAKALSQQSKPLVIDADGLNILSEKPEYWKMVPNNSILTPHDGELQRLVGEWTDDYDRLEKAKKLSTDKDVILVLKGAHTIIVSGKSMYINDTGNPGMATAGSGDVLAGVIAGLLAQSYDPLTAAVFGVFIHGTSGDIASQTYAHEGLKASIISNFVGAAILELFRPEPQQQPQQAPQQ